MAEEKTHIEVNRADKERLEAIKKKSGYASIRVVVNKLLAKHGNKEL